MSTTKNNKKDAATTTPVEIPQHPTPVNFVPEFLRLPKPGQLCPLTGLSRSAINELILPNLHNGNKPPVRSFCLRKKGAATGIRIVDYASLREYIFARVEA
ncbi:MAG TPA: hypothetical protein VN784_08175 [Candidatus Limnocylindrales bacterium]|nr:hypothetical protein [Candidatus Limnocylindrales bacterium]